MSTHCHRDVPAPEGGLSVGLKVADSKLPTPHELREEDAEGLIDWILSVLTGPSPAAEEVDLSPEAVEMLLQAAQGEGSVMDLWEHRYFGQSAEQASAPCLLFLGM